MNMGQVMETVSYGLYLLCSRRDGRDNGCVINTAMQVTTRPNRVAFAVNARNYTHDMLLGGRGFALCVLSEKAGPELYRRFGLQSGRTVDKFAGLAGQVKRADNGVLYVTQGVNAWMEGTVASTLDLGTHTLFLADITGGGVLSGEPSATYAYYQAHVKPRPEQTAPQAGGKKRWVCKACGYVYEGDALPADFICPWCNHPAEDFEPLP